MEAAVDALVAVDETATAVEVDEAGVSTTAATAAADVRDDAEAEP